MRIEMLDLRGFGFSLKRRETGDRRFETRNKRQETRRLKPAVLILESKSKAVLGLLSISAAV
jgi:hypothetical protein